MTLLFQILMLIAFSYIAGLIIHQFVYIGVLILDVSKWRCGGAKSMLDKKENVLGEGYTRLLNREGYMCCLGQFYLQIDRTFNSNQLIGVGNPQFLNSKTQNILLDEDLNDSKLSDDAIKINDNKDTTIDEKISQLKSLFKKHGYRIKVINMHKIK